MGASEHTPREITLLTLANRQHGMVRDDQLTGHGLARKAIDKRVQTGRLTRLHDGIFSWGHSALIREGRWLAALWACGDGVVLSHRTAAAFHGIGKEVGADVHVSTIKRSIHSRPGIVVHRVSRLERADVQQTRLLRITQISRAVVDLADVVPWEEVRSAVDALHSFSPAELRAAQRRAPGRAGRGVVTRLQMEADRLRDEGYQLAGHRILRFLWDDFDEARQLHTAQRLRKMLSR